LTSSQKPHISHQAVRRNTRKRPAVTDDLNGFFRSGLLSIRSSRVNNMTIQIRPATLDDAPALSRLGAATFRDTFEGANTPGDMARYLADAFTPEQQAAEIADPAGAVLLAEDSGGSGDAELLGYAHLLSGQAQDAYGAPPRSNSSASTSRVRGMDGA
jgi:hypothetical protein